MDGFNFWELDPTLREKILCKLEFKSYFRIQQTCKDMLEYISNNRRVKVYLKGWLSINFRKNELQLQIHHMGKLEPVYLVNSADSLTGVHFEQISPFWLGEYEQVYLRMKTSRITCTVMHINPSTSKLKCEMCLKILKPIVVQFGHQWPQYASCLEAKGLKNIKMTIPHFQLNKVVEQVLSARNLERIHITSSGRPGEKDQLDWFIHVLKRLRGRKLRYFYLVEHWSRPLPPLEEILEKLEELAPTVAEMSDTKYSLKCAFGPDGIDCQFTIDAGQHPYIQIHLCEIADPDPRYMRVH